MLDVCLYPLARIVTTPSASAAILRAIPCRAVPEKKRDNHVAAPVASAPRQTDETKIPDEKKVSFSIRLF
jgi:hypothetical protein